MKRIHKTFWLGLLILATVVACTASTPATKTATAPGETTITNTPAVPPPAPPTATATVLGPGDQSSSPISPLSINQDETPTSPLAPPTPEAVPVYTYTIIKAYPHDPNAFTQGLVFEDGVLYEGTGLRGRSSLRRVALETGEVLQSINLQPQFFGEGITIFDDQIYQLTWQSNVGFVYDKQSFELLQEFYYPTEGWGLTHDGERLIMSDGTATLHYIDPETLEEIGKVEVIGPNGPVFRLNELEYVQGEIYANVWQTNRIARIDPGTGRVLGWIDLRGLLSSEDLTQPVDVLNGIAYDAKGDRLFVTGKLWPKLFEIVLVDLID